MPSTDMTVIRIVFKVDVAPTTDVFVEYRITTAERDRLMAEANQGDAHGVYEVIAPNGDPRKLFLRFAHVVYIG